MSFQISKFFEMLDLKRFQKIW